MNTLKRSIPNIVTLSRSALACVFAALLPGRFDGDIGLTVPLLLFAVICISDFLDGRLARSLGAVSETGAYLDLYGDFFYIALSLVTLNLLGRMPLWFTAVVTLKFIEYLITSRILRRNGMVFVFDPLGRGAAGLFFAAPGAACMFCGVHGWEHVFYVVLYLAAVLATVSSITRSVSCARVVKGGVLHGR